MYPVDEGLYYKQEAYMMDNPIEHRPHPEYVLGRGSSQDHIENIIAPRWQAPARVERLSPTRSPSREDPIKTSLYKQ